MAYTQEEIDYLMQSVDDLIKDIEYMLINEDSDYETRSYMRKIIDVIRSHIK